MRRQNAEGYRPRCVRWFRAIGLTFTGILLVAASSHAGVLNVSWTAPTKNTDGSSLADLALYRVYYSTSASPCPGSSFVQVAASTLIPSPNQTVSLQLTGLTTGSTYRVSVTAVDRDGKEGVCSAVASAVAQGDSAVTPTGPVSTGIGTTASDTKPPLPPATSARPPQSPHAIGPSNDADDPRAVIDWLLDRSSSRGAILPGSRPALAQARASVPVGAALPGPPSILAQAHPAPAAPVGPAPASEQPIGLPRVKDYKPTPELRDIYFDFGSAVIRPRDVRILDTNAEWLHANPGQLVLIEGHCDHRGATSTKNEFNMDLGERRAQAAMNHLIAQGVHPSRITILSYGEERPQCPEESERCWSQNRRSRFLVKPR